MIKFMYFIVHLLEKKVCHFLSGDTGQGALGIEKIEREKDQFWKIPKWFCYYFIKMICMNIMKIEFKNEITTLLINMLPERF